MGTIPDNNRFESFISCFYIFLVIYGIILGILHFIPSPFDGYNSFISYFIIEEISPLMNSLFDWIVQIFGYTSIMGDGNTLFARIGLSSTNLNMLTWIYGGIICLLCSIAIIGIIEFRNKRRSGWIIITYLSIHLIGLIIGAIFFKYLINKDEQLKFH